MKVGTVVSHLRPDRKVLHNYYLCTVIQTID
jgi:hypothetical protein